MLERVRTRFLRFVGGIRLRLVWWFIVVLALATVGSVILVRQVLVQRLDARIESELVQEVNEVQRLAEGNDPETGEPFGPRVDRIFEVFLERNIPPRARDAGDVRRRSTPWLQPARLSSRPSTRSTRRTRSTRIAALTAQWAEPRRTRPRTCRDAGRRDRIPRGAVPRRRRAPRGLRRRELPRPPARGHGRGVACGGHRRAGDARHRIRAGGPARRAHPRAGPAGDAHRSLDLGHRPQPADPGPRLRRDLRAIGRRSTRCSSGSRPPSRRSAGSSTTPATSCARRSR